MNTEEIRKHNLGILPIEIPHAEDYQWALSELDLAESSFLGMNLVVKLLVREAIAAIGNALDLFKTGYSDAACYCLRQAIELATCFTYIHELPENERQEKLSAWRTHAKWFPLRGKMEKKLRDLGGEYADLHTRMPRFFQKVETITERINKHIHKQGYEYCYCYRNLLPPAKKQTVVDSIVREYESFIEEAIGVVAVSKLVLDPFPILLSEEEIANRLPGFMTEPYSHGFLEKYIGEDFLNEFKTTRRYEEFRNEIMKRARINDAVYDLKQWQHFERSNINQILNQIEQLDYYERFVVLLAHASKKIAHILFFDGLSFYTTDVKCNLTATSMSSEDYRQFHFHEKKKNNPFKGTLLSVFPTYDNDFCFVEHDVPFDDNEWVELNALVKQYNQSIAHILQDVSPENPDGI